MNINAITKNTIKIVPNKTKEKLLIAFSEYCLYKTVPNPAPAVRIIKTIFISHIVQIKQQVDAFKNWDKPTFISHIVQIKQEKKKARQVISDFIYIPYSSNKTLHK